MRPDEQPTAEAGDLFARFVEMMHGIRHRAHAARSGSGRAAVRRPDSLAVRIDVNAVRTAPGPPFDRGPVQGHAIRIGPAVDRGDLIGLWSAAALRRLARLALRSSFGLSLPLPLLAVHGAAEQRQTAT